MNNIPPILESWDFAEIENTFRKKIIILMDAFEVAIDDDKYEEIQKYKIDVENLFIEYYETAEELAQYGTGLKKTQFLDASKQEIEYMKQQLEEAAKKLTEQKD